MIGKKKTLKKMLDKSLFERQLSMKNNPLYDKLIAEGTTRKSHLGKEYAEGQEVFYVLLETYNAQKNPPEMNIKVAVVLEEEFDKYKLTKLNSFKKSRLMPIVELVNDEV